MRRKPSIHLLAVLKFCWSLFRSGLLEWEDFDDLSLAEVHGRDFARQPHGAGVHVTFSVSWKAIDKTGKGVQEALDVLLADDGATAVVDRRDEN